MKTTDRRAVAIALAMLGAPLVLSPVLERSAHAQAAPSELDRANARKLFNEGLDLRKAGDQAGALAKLEAADAIFATPRGRLEVGRQRVLLGRLVEGWTALLSVANVQVAPKDEAKYAPNREEAAKLAKEIEARIPTIRLTLQGVPEGKLVAVRVDGALVPAAALVEPRMVNPGAHVVTATVEGHPEVRQDVVLKEGEARAVTLTIPPAAASGAAAPTPPPAVDDAPPGALAKAPTSLPSSPVDQPSEPARDPGSGQRTLALVAGGVGLVAIGVGSWLGLSARASARDADAGHCNARNECDSQGIELRRDAIRQADLATIAFVAGGAFLGGATVLWLTAPEKKPTGVGRASVVIGLGSVALSGTF